MGSSSYVCRSYRGKTGRGGGGGGGGFLATSSWIGLNETSSFNDTTYSFALTFSILRENLRCLLYFPRKKEKTQQHKKAAGIAGSRSSRLRCGYRYAILAKRLISDKTEPK